jgi:hypothetical protein
MLPGNPDVVRDRTANNLADTKGPGVPCARNAFHAAPCLLIAERATRFDLAANLVTHGDATNNKQASMMVASTSMSTRPG